MNPLTSTPSLAYSSPSESVDLWSLLKNPQTRAQAILDKLSEREQLRACYSKDAGVSEGLTVGEHSRRVLEVALKYADSLKTQISIPWEEFLLFLALHDIGKGVAKEQEAQNAFSSSIGFKDSELAATREILAAYLAEMGVPQERIDALSALLSYDSQGLYLREHIDKYEAVDTLSEMAQQCNWELLPFYNLFCIYHMVDAASYETLANCFEFREKTLEYCPDYQKKTEELVAEFRQIEEGEKSFKSGLKSEEVFLAALPKLFSFLRWSHKRLLFNRGKNKQEFKAIKNGFRDLFLQLAKSNLDLKTYEYWLGNSCGNSDFSYFDQIPFVKGYDPLLVAFLLELIDFRRDYLCRFSMEKVKKCLPAETEAKSLSLLNITFLHGSNSGVLPNLLNTGLQLVCTGRLLKAGIIPFSGELHRGSSATGVNRFSISGTRLDDAMRAYNYAEGKTYQTDQKADEQALTVFLNALESINLQTAYDFRGAGDWICIVPLKIKRIRILNPSLIEPLKERFRLAAEKIEGQIATFKQGDTYRTYMPTALDPDGSKGYRWQDDYYALYFTIAEEAVKEIQEALDCPLVIPPGIQAAITTPFPLLFGSKIVHTEIPLVTSSERLAVRPLKLGKEIELIFTKEEHKAELKTFLQGQRLQVEVLTLKDLEKAMELNKAAATFFADFASRKKLEKLVEIKKE